MQTTHFYLTPNLSNIVMFPEVIMPFCYNFITFFQNSLKFTAELRRKYRDSSVSIASMYAQHLQLSTFPTTVVHLLQLQMCIDESTLTVHNYPKFTVYIMIHSWLCTFYGFGQMHNGTQLSLRYHIFSLLYISLKILCALHPFPHPLFCLFVVFCCSVTKSYLSLCNSMECSIPGFPVLHYLLEFAQVNVH